MSPEGNTGETASEVTGEESTRSEFGKPVFDSDGNRLEGVSGFDDAGFYVTMREGEAMSVECVRTDVEFGETELMWRYMVWAATIGPTDLVHRHRSVLCADVEPPPWLETAERLRTT